MADHNERAETLIAQGYCRVSRKFRIIARIDRADWIERVARAVGRRPDELCSVVVGRPDVMWADYYRRCLSKDTIEGVDPEVFKLIPLSDAGGVEFVVPEEPDAGMGMRR